YTLSIMLLKSNKQSHTASAVSLVTLLVTITAAIVLAPTKAEPVKGRVFDHVFIAFLENTDYDLAFSDPALRSFLSQGILLTNYYAVTHPSQPNYIAAIGGDYYGLNNDRTVSIPANYTTIVDLLEPKGLTWKTYQEDLPDTPCFKDTQSNGVYFRKHNPFVIHESISLNPDRCKNIVPSSQLYTDLANAQSSSSSNKSAPATPMPNYMFYTPNMIHDGHNTTVADASLWLASFLPPLLGKPSSSSPSSSAPKPALPPNTLVVISFDETDDYNIPNRVWTLLLGDVIPDQLRGTTDSTFYTHYSLLSTCSSNWDLPSLGRNDADPTLSNVFNLVAQKTQYRNHNISMAQQPLLNGTEPGFLAMADPISTQSSSARSSWERGVVLDRQRPIQRPAVLASAMVLFSIALAVLF
ncbi:hypothetical protein BGW38_008188, partial [Lunasporangiospora selenospora]